MGSYNTIRPRKAINGFSWNNEEKNKTIFKIEDFNKKQNREMAISVPPNGVRLFWFFSFGIAACLAGYFISNIYVKWSESPVIISFSPLDADLNSIPFPSITICNMNQAKRPEAEHIVEHGTPAQKKLLEDYCNLNNEPNQTEYETDWDTMQNFLITVGQSCNDMLKQCLWKNEKVDCDDYFNNDLTDEGLCCSFNRLPPNMVYWNPKSLSYLNQTYSNNIYDWNPEDGFPDVISAANENFIPRRPLGAGQHLGLSITLDTQVDKYYCSSTYSVGFKIVLSNPIETPKTADFGFLLSPGVEARYVINPTIREATDSLKNVAIEKRKCYFSNERTLQYFRFNLASIPRVMNFSLLNDVRYLKFTKDREAVFYYAIRKLNEPKEISGVHFMCLHS
ncbi:hypothetical protein HHI36_004234 [Cryptolaemus montrouzieri]|uniref:Sodium channel protein Nach n=1 Tax=Cryptolaemus montrouzieri TaxID=559131 RepID=A0ABD2NQU0_9CUCU